MKTHKLKTINPYFTDVWEGRKLVEVRKDDRGFAVGDLLWLREYEGYLINPDNDSIVSSGGYTGREITAYVTYLLPANTFEGLARDYCLMGIRVLKTMTVEL